MEKRARIAKVSFSHLIAVAIAGVFLLSAAQAQAPRHNAPEWWPCIQRYVPKLSVGAFWDGGLSPSDSWRENESITRLTEKFSDRKIPVEENLEDIRIFLASVEDPTSVAADLVRGLQHAVNQQRDHIIAGIGRFAERQTMMIRRIEKQSQAMENPDLGPAQKRDLESRQKWDIRVFEEREGMMAYLCEQPVLLEKKFFAVGRAIAASQNKR